MTDELKRELESRRRQVVQLEERLKMRDSKEIELQLQIRQVEEERVRAIEEVRKRDFMLQSQSNSLQMERMIKELQQENLDLKAQVKRLDNDSRLLEGKRSEIEYLTKRLAEAGAADNLIEDKEKHSALRRDVKEKTDALTLLSKQTQELASENRVLREMANVPANFGVDLRAIALVESQKLEEYKARVNILEHEVEEREKECTDLRRKLRNMSTLYGEKGLRFHEISAEQMRMVDEFASNLKAGKIELPTTDESVRLQKEVTKLKAQLNILESRAFGYSEGSHDHLLEELRREHKETKELLLKLYSGTKPTTSEEDTVSRNALSLPPVPIQNANEEFKEGYSYRFSTKLPVADIYTGNAKRDLAALQLQVVELVELLNRRDEEENIAALEAESFRKQLREILLVHEELFTEYAIAKEKWQEEVELNKNELENCMQELREARAQIGVYQDMADALKYKDPAKIASFANRLAVSEAQNVRLTRKYESLASQVHDLKDLLNNLETEHAEKDVIVIKRIGKLKEWRVSASMQMQFLFHQLRQSVSAEKFENVSRQLEMLKSRQAEWLTRESELYKKVYNLENAERENTSLIQKIRETEELRQDMVYELDLLSRRLESLDSSYRSEQEGFKKVLEHLRQRYISPEQAFSLFDKNRDGRISRMEFRAALENLGIRLTPSEFTSLFDSFDSDGSIHYKSFARKLLLYGVVSATEEQQVLQMILDGIQRSGLSLKAAFDIFDTDRSGFISKEEFVSCVINLEVGLTRPQAFKVAGLVRFNKDNKMGFADFARLFERHLPSHSNRPSPQWKDAIFARIYKEIKVNGIDLKEAFARFDANGNGRISKNEFVNAFAQIDPGLSRNQVDQLWTAVDADRNGEISYLEFVSQFNNSVRQRETLQSIHVEQNSAGNKRSSPALATSMDRTELRKTEKYYK